MYVCKCVSIHLHTHSLSGSESGYPRYVILNDVTVRLIRCDTLRDFIASGLG